MKTAKAIPLLTLLIGLGASAQAPETGQYGPDPKLPQPHRGLLPVMKIANPASWGDKRPNAAQGYSVSRGYKAAPILISRRTLACIGRLHQ